MHYSSGELAQVGDKVLIEHGQTEGIVEHLIDSNNALVEWGMEPNGEFGLLIAAAPFGLVFWKIEELYDPVILVRRAKDEF